MTLKLWRSIYFIVVRLAHGGVVVGPMCATRLNLALRHQRANVGLTRTNEEACCVVRDDDARVNWIVDSRP